MRRFAAGVLAILAAAACGRRESPEVARDRARRTFLVSQIAGLEQTIARAERGELQTGDKIAIGLSESIAKSLLNASLPLELNVTRSAHGTNSQTRSETRYSTSC